MTQSEPEQKTHNQHSWSGRHVRLKYQMVLSAILFFSISTYKLHEFNYFGFFKTINTPTQHLIEIVIFLFFIFNITSFLIKTNTENAHNINWHTYSTETFESAENAFNLLSNKLDELSKPLAHIIPGSVDKYISQSERIITYSKECITALNFIQNNPVPKRTDKAARQNFAEYLLLSLEKNEVKENDLNNEARHLIHNLRDFGHIGDVYTLSMDMGDFINDLNTTAEDLKQKLKKYDDRTKELEVFYNEQVQQQIQDVRTTLPKLKESQSEIIKRIQNFDRLNSFEHNALSVYIPTIASLIAIIFGILNSHTLEVLTIYLGELQNG